MSLPVSRGSLGAVAVMASASLLLSACSGSGGSDASADSSDGGSDLYTVQRVIDGDTIEVEGQGDQLTVRLLNIDPPETKDPNEIVECLGPEATEELKSLLNEGDQVRLEYDVERRDSYGRTLAGVYEDDVLVNAEIARAGLGVPMAVDPNYRFYEEVKAAFDEAANAQVGFFDPSIRCTIPAEEEAAQSPEDAQEVLDTIEEAADSHAWVAELRDHHAMSAYLSDLRFLSQETSDDDEESSLPSDGADPLGGAESSAGGDDDQYSLPDSVKDYDLDQDFSEDLSEVEQYIPDDARDAVDDYVDLPEVSAPEPVAPAPAPAPAPRPAPAPAPKPAPAPQPAPAPAPEQNDNSSSGGDGAYPGYTGPRCYAPGGKTWTPC